jgi:hypothetical protein
MRHEDETYLAASCLWDLLFKIPEMGMTRVSKLMARKRPRLVPIWDHRVDDFYGNPYWKWTPLSIALRDVSRRDRLSRLRVVAGAPPETSLLRVLDVAIWSSSREGLSRKDVRIARVPEGTDVTFLHGRAGPQASRELGVTVPGGGEQFRFLDFDEDCIVATRRLP